MLDLLNRVIAHVNASLKGPKQLSVHQPTDVKPSAPLPVDDPWDIFATAVLQLELPSTVSIFHGFSQLFERKTFQEPFYDCADQRWLDRYAGARIVRDAMEKQRGHVATVLPPGARLAYDHLSSAVSSYGMAIAGQLLEEHKFGTDHQGRLIDADGRLAVCERRREAIRAAYLRLCDPVPPVFDDARIYEELTDLEERKIRLIHPLEQMLDTAVGELSTPEWRLRRAATSPWLYDRLVFFIHAARATDLLFPSLEELIEGWERELNLLEAREAPTTLVGLYYALEAIEVRATRIVDRPRILDLLSRIDVRVEDWNRPVNPRSPKERVDLNGIRRLAARIRVSLASTDRTAR